MDIPQKKEAAAEKALMAVYHKYGAQKTADIVLRVLRGESSVAPDSEDEPPYEVVASGSSVPRQSIEESLETTTPRNTVQKADRDAVKNRKQVCFRDTLSIINDDNPKFTDSQTAEWAGVELNLSDVDDNDLDDTGDNLLPTKPHISTQQSRSDIVTGCGTSSSRVDNNMDIPTSDTI